MENQSSQVINAPTQKKALTTEKITDAVVRDVYALQREGTIPMTARTFDELHSYCDASRLGDLSEYLRCDAAAAGLIDRTENDTLPSDILQMVDDAREKVSVWLTLKSQTGSVFKTKKGSYRVVLKHVDPLYVRGVYQNGEESNLHLPYPFFITNFELVADAAVKTPIDQPESGPTAQLTQRMAEALPATSGYEKGFRDALESIALALTPTVATTTLDTAITTVLDAYGNNAEDADTITLNLNIFDDDGIVVDGTTADLTADRLSDIVDTASQLILLYRTDKQLDQALAELDEALTVSGVISNAG